MGKRKLPETTLKFNGLRQTTWRETSFEALSTHLHCQVIFPVIGQALVELSILFVANVIRISGPNRLCFVQFFLINVFLLDLFLFLLVTILLFFFLFIRANVFYLRFVLRLLFFFFLFFFFVFLFFYCV